MAELEDLRARINTASQEVARNEARQEQAQRDLRAALTLLEQEFGAKSVEEAKKLRTKLKREQTAELARLEKHLDSLGA